MAKKVEIDKGLCIGCGTCVSLCPDCFELGGDGKSEVRQGCDENCCDLGDVAENCPVQAITVSEE